MPFAALRAAVRRALRRSRTPPPPRATRVRSERSEATRHGRSRRSGSSDGRPRGRRARPAHPRQTQGGLAGPSTRTRTSRADARGRSAGRRIPVVARGRKAGVKLAIDPRTVVLTEAVRPAPLPFRRRRPADEELRARDEAGWPKRDREMRRARPLKIETRVRIPLGPPPTSPGDLEAKVSAGQF